MVNGAGNTFYDVRIPGLKLTVVHADGVDVEPVTVDEFRFGPGETVDVIVQPRMTLTRSSPRRWTGQATRVPRWPCVKVFKLPCLPSIRSNG